MVRRSRRRTTSKQHQVRRDTLASGSQKTAATNPKSSSRGSEMIRTMKIISMQKDEDPMPPLMAMPSQDRVPAPAKVKEESREDKSTDKVNDDVISSWWRELSQGEWIKELFHGTEDSREAALQSEEHQIEDLAEDQSEKEVEEPPLVNGYIVVSYPNGDVYEGNWQDGKRHGIGKLTFGHGRGYYDGEWKEGVYDGLGTLCWTPAHLLSDDDGEESPFSGSQRRYEGEFKDGFFHGLGREYGTDGALRREGMWENGMLKNAVVIHVLPQPSYTLARLSDVTSNTSKYDDELEEITEEEEDNRMQNKVVEEEEEVNVEEEEEEEEDAEEAVEEEEEKDSFDRQLDLLMGPDAISNDAKTYNRVLEKEKTARAWRDLEAARRARAELEYDALDFSQDPIIKALTPRCPGAKQRPSFATTTVSNKELMERKWRESSSHYHSSIKGE